MMHRSVGWAALAVCVAGCLPADPLGASTPATIAIPAQERDYRLGAADKVRVLVFNEPTLSGDFVVNTDGSVSLPLIGSVPAIDKTSVELSHDIETRLLAGYLLQPRVSIEVLNFRPYYILGEVNKPGEYPYAAGLNVVDAVATAQGFTYRADKRRVYVKANKSAIELQEPLTPSILVQPGDTIRIGERYF